MTRLNANCLRTSRNRKAAGKSAGRSCVFDSLEGRRLLSITLTTLVDFNGTNGSAPESALSFDSSGNLYGTTATGGLDNDGTIFELIGPTYNGLNTLATFKGSTGDDIEDGLYSDGQGDFFGTAYVGGPDLSSEGTVWEWSPSDGQTPQVLVNFQSDSQAAPQEGMVSGGDGNLYGTTQLGGSGDGTIFQLAGPGYTTLTNLVTFNVTNGNDPEAALYYDGNGHLFGETKGGGQDHDGTIFELSGPNYDTFTTLDSFNGPDGTEPTGGLIADASGNLYGTTFSGGNANGDGTIFKLAAPNYNTITTLADFNYSNGEGPESGLLMDAAGNLFGVTRFGGNGGTGGGTDNGVVYELPAGSNTPISLHNFNYTDGSNPESTLVADASGNLYGTTEAGGTSTGGGSGTVFELSGAAFVPPVGTLADGVLTINGTNSYDTIALTTSGSTLTVTMNGASTPYALSSITSIDVNGNSGPDLITLGPGVPAASVQGGPGADTITASDSGNDTLGGGKGHDSITAGSGNDLIHGGAGADTIIGGSGNSTILGGLGLDVLRGGSGDDQLNGGAGFNQMYAGTGTDAFYAVNGTDDQIFAGSATNDSLYYSPSDAYVIETGAIPPANVVLFS